MQSGSWSTITTRRNSFESLSTSESCFKPLANDLLFAMFSLEYGSWRRAPSKLLNRARDLIYRVRGGWRSCPTYANQLLRLIDTGIGRPATDRCNYFKTSTMSSGDARSNMHLEATFTVQTMRNDDYSNMSKLSKRCIWNWSIFIPRLAACLFFAIVTHIFTRLSRRCYWSDVINLLLYYFSFYTYVENIIQVYIF